MEVYPNYYREKIRNSTNVLHHALLISNGNKGLQHSELKVMMFTFYEDGRASDDSESGIP
jgi:hypothetical protein